MLKTDVVYVLHIFCVIVIVAFPLENEPSVSLVAWTTTPWTLPSNLTLCVNPSLTYVKIKGKAVTRKVELLWLV